MGAADAPRALARGDIEGARLSEPDTLMLRYALKLTAEPHSVSREDVDELRRAGFDDPAIHDICHVASYYNYVNRLADGLGVELEDGWSDDDLTLSRKEFDALRREGRS